MGYRGTGGVERNWRPPLQPSSSLEKIMFLGAPPTLAPLPGGALGIGLGGPIVVVVVAVIAVR
eukprot:6125061-Pyramimonas_sp.AAC.1